MTTRWRRGLEQAIARAYGLTYDAVVEGFAPYEALRDEVAGYVRRSAPPGARVVDVACGIGNVCLRLGEMGYAVQGYDAVGSLIEVARAKQRAARNAGSVQFDELEVANAAAPGEFDVLVSLNTLYWHPDPEGFVRACRAALVRDGHAVFVTYVRPARVVGTALEVRAAQGTLAALRSLRWLVPTALFERLRDFEPRYLDPREMRAMLEHAGFEVLEERAAFLAGMCHLAWARAR
ncbi:MAG TPA: methyltransferase domain-containing protein [Kofleriaceae bacterium]|nr:methyltransferase domain-containing protein [Kofleriaceae bacterium]